MFKSLLEMLGKSKNEVVEDDSVNEPFSMQVNSNKAMTVNDRQSTDENDYFDKLYSSYSDNTMYKKGFPDSDSKMFVQDRQGTIGESFTKMGMLDIGLPSERGWFGLDTFLPGESGQYGAMPLPSNRQTPLSKNLFTGKGFSYYGPVQPESAERLNKLKSFERQEGEGSIPMFNRMYDEGIAEERYYEPSTLLDMTRGNK